MTDALNALQPLLDLVGLNVQTVTAAMSLLLALQFVTKIFSGWVTKKLLAAIALAKSTEDTRDDEAIMRLLNNRWYLRAAFLIDLFLRVKLPRAEDFTRVSVS